MMNAHLNCQKTFCIRKNTICVNMTLKPFKNKHNCCYYWHYVTASKQILKHYNFPQQGANCFTDH